MRMNCTHTFTLEGDGRAELEEKLSDYSALVRKASEKLGIGYSHGLVFGQPANGYEKPPPTEDAPLERLFGE